MRRTLLVSLVLLFVVAVAAWLWRPGWDLGGEGSAREGRDAGSSAVDLAAQLRGRDADETEAESAGEGQDEPRDPSDTTATVTGRIVGPAGAPVAASEALGLGVLSLLGNADVYTSAPADETGRFVLEVTRGLATTVAATAPGYGVVLGPRLLLEQGATHDVGTLELASEKTIPVRVEDEAGAPVAGAALSLQTEASPVPEWWEALRAANEDWSFQESDEEGRVAFRKVPPGTYRILLDHEGAVPRDQVREHVAAGDDTVVFVVPVVPPSEPETVRVQVKVVGPDGLLAPHAYVVLFGRNTRAPAQRTQEGLWSGQIEDAHRPVHLVVSEARDARGQELGYRPATVFDVRTQAEPILVQLEDGLSIEGRVIWDGAPTRWGIELLTRLQENGRGRTGPEAYQAGLPRVTFQSRTDEKGAFRLVGLPPGHLDVFVDGPGRLRDAPLVVTPPAHDLLLHMVNTRLLRLEVRAPAGQRLTHASVRVHRWVGRGLLFRYSANGGDSDDPAVRTFEIPGLDPKARFRVAAEGRGLGGRTREVVVPAVEPRDEPYVLQLEEGLHVKGRVVRADGTPVWGGVVHYRPWPGGMYQSYIFVEGRWLGNAKTNQAGEFDLGGLDEGDILLAVEAPGLTALHHPPRVRAGTRGHEIVVEPAHTITGRLVDPAGGSVDGLRVTAVPAEGSPRLWVPQRTSADGFFVAGYVGPGSYRIVAWNPDDEDARYALSAPVPAGARDVSLELSAGDQVEGVVRDAEGQVVVGVKVWLTGPWTIRSAPTGQAGNYYFGGLPPGDDYELAFVTPQGTTLRKGFVAIAEGKGAVVDVTLPD